ncbi:CG42784, isoform F [Anopheles sinensis]|uniref:CG42784, isoform F n=1 Tax=Anopheles sinensis TaxID=74873 RepID=A0A084W7F0_ANOSI|nr:CG42784, isoform F [Anopheles sinensis]
MYAAAGGASLASRQARKKQAAQNTKNKATNQQILREKLAAKAASTPTKSKPFHQLPASYLRAPHQHHRKLSAGYTSIPGSDQPHQHPRFGFGSEAPCAAAAVAGPAGAGAAHGHGPHFGGHGHHHHHHHHGAGGVPHGAPCHLHGGAGGLGGQHPAHGASFPPLPKPTGFREYDKLVRRQQLTKSATATLPLVSQAQQDLTPPQSPTLGGFGDLAAASGDHHQPNQQLHILQAHNREQHQQHQHPHPHVGFHVHYSHQQLAEGTCQKGAHHHREDGESEAQQQQLTQPLTLQIPDDPIIITPATPQATPPGRLGLKPLALTDDEEALPLTSPTPGTLERKCSVYRGRKLDPYEEHFYNTTTISNAAGHQAYHPDDVFFPPVPNGGGGGGGGHSTTTTTPGHAQTKWDEYYCCECDHRQYGVCTCDQFEEPKEESLFLSNSNKWAEWSGRYIETERDHNPGLHGKENRFPAPTVPTSSFVRALLFVSVNQAASFFHSTHCLSAPTESRHNIWGSKKCRPIETEPENEEEKENFYNQPQTESEVELEASALPKPWMAKARN